MRHSEIFELSPIKAMELAASKVPNVISLAQGIPSFPTPQVIKDFVTEKINQGLCDKYSLTIGLSELREEISQTLLKEGLQFDPETEILATAGSIEGITAALLSLTSPGDEIILPSPSYVSYQGAIGIARCKAVFAPLDEDNNFDFDLEAMQRAITPKTKVILYCSPNNPTGTLFSEEKTRKIVDLAEKHDLTIVVDEVYKDFYYSNDKHFSAMHIPAARKRVIRVCSFSKSYAMTGWRIGFVHADKSLLQGMLKFHDAMVTCAPVVSQYAAIAALRFGETYLENFRNIFRERRDYTIKILDSLSHILDYQLPRAAYFAFPRIKDTVPFSNNSKKLAYDILDKVALALVPGSAFGPSGESHLRISFGREKRDLEEGLARFQAYFNKTDRIPAANSAVHEVAKPTNGFIKKWGIEFLGTCARIKLSKSKPLIIGIAGLKGKTVHKRFITEVLGKEKSVRSNILSYNTSIGFPLSVLNIDNPAKNKSYVKFLLKVLNRTFLPQQEQEILVLEYGILSTEDSENLMAIAKPDWLVLTEITGGDIIGVDAAAEGIENLSKCVPPENILWTKNDAHLNAMKINFVPNLALDSGSIVDKHLNAQVMRTNAGNALIGSSAKNAIISSVIIASKLGVSNAAISSFLRQYE